MMSWRLFMSTKWRHYSIRICRQFVVSQRSGESRMKQKSRWSRSWCSSIRSRQDTTKLWRHLSLHRQERSPSALLDFSTFCFRPICLRLFSTWECSIPLWTRFRKSHQQSAILGRCVGGIPKPRSNNQQFAFWWLWSPAGSTLRWFQKNSALWLEEASFNVEAEKWRLQGSSQSFHDFENPFLKLFWFLWGSFWNLLSTTKFGG